MEQRKRDLASRYYYKFIGKDGKEHTVLSLGGALHTGLFGNSPYDKEAADYVNFWNSLAREKPSGIYMKFSSEEIRSRLAEAGIENGFFTVNIGGRNTLPADQRASASWTLSRMAGIFNDTGVPKLGIFDRIEVPEGEQKQIVVLGKHSVLHHR